MQDSSYKDISQRIARAEAAAWLARLRADDCRRADENDFQLWLKCDPMNAAAFEEVTETWKIARGLRRDIVAPSRYNAQSGFVSRRAMMAGLGVAVAGLGAISLWQPASAKIYETDIGEQKHIALDDGSQVFLDTATRISVCYGDALRSIALQFGRANFQVVSDANRPFVVEAAEHKIIAKSSNFDVRCDNGRVQVVLIRGEASIRPVRAPNSAALLVNGDRLVVADTGVVRDKPDLRPLLAWQTGQAIFEDVPLSDAVREMNRYSTDTLQVPDARVASLRLSGAYRVGDNRAFANSVAALLSVNVREYDNQIILADETR